MRADIAEGVRFLWRQRLRTNLVARTTSLLFVVGFALAHELMAALAAYLVFTVAESLAIRAVPSANFTLRSQTPNSPTLATISEGAEIRRWRAWINPAAYLPDRTASPNNAGSIVDQYVNPGAGMPEGAPATKLQ